MASLLAFSRGAWVNLAVALVAYAYFAFASAASHRQRLKLIIYVTVGAFVALGILAAALSIPSVAELMNMRASLEQPYDVAQGGRFVGQLRALSLVITHPFGLGALEFARAYYEQDAHEVYLSMFLNAGWLGGTLYIAVVLLTLGLGLRQVIRDRGGDGVGAVLTRRLHRHGGRRRDRRHRSLAQLLSRHGDDLGHGARVCHPRDQAAQGHKPMSPGPSK